MSVASEAPVTARPRAGRSRTALALLVLIVCPVLLGFGDSPEGRNRQGNKHYRESQYDEALTEYRSAQVLAPELLELFFNAGDALFRKGEMPDALREFGKAAGAEDPFLASGAHYNSGNAHLQLGDIQSAIEAYKDALRRNPADADAKHNLEVALRLLEQQEQQQQQQQEQQQDQDQQDQEQNQEDQEQQEQEQDQQDQEQQDQEQQDQEQQDQEQQDQEQQDQEQQDQEQQEQEQQDQEQQEPQEPQEEPAMSPEDAARLLDAIDHAERELQAELRAAQARKREKVEKDW